jgi:hypothetical protein
MIFGSSLYALMTMIFTIAAIVLAIRAVLIGETHDLYAYASSAFIGLLFIYLFYIMSSAMNKKK